MTRLKYLCIWLKVVFSSYDFYLRPKHVIALGSRTLMFINDNKTMDDGSFPYNVEHRKPDYMTSMKCLCGATY